MIVEFEKDVFGWVQKDIIGRAHGYSIVQYHYKNPRGGCCGLEHRCKPYYVAYYCGSRIDEAKTIQAAKKLCCEHAEGLK